MVMALACPTSAAVASVTQPRRTRALRARATPSRARSQVVVRAGNPFVGETNDPEKTAQNKEKKKKESFWAEPHNNNPLEKTTIMRGDPEEGGKIEGGDVGEKIKDAVQGAQDAVKDAVDKATGKE